MDHLIQHHQVELLLVTCIQLPPVAFQVEKIIKVYEVAEEESAVHQVVEDPVVMLVKTLWTFLARY